MKKLLILIVLFNCTYLIGFSGEPPVENELIDQTELNEGLEKLDSQMEALNAQIEEQQKKLYEERMKSYNEQNIKNLNEFVARQNEQNEKKKRSNYIRLGMLLVLAVSFVISRVARKKAKDAQQSEDNQ